MPTTSTFDCSSLSPETYPPPVYIPCWGNRPLPTTMSFSAGPSTPIPPNTSCPTGWPTTVITGTLTRNSPCSFAWGYSNGSFAILFAWTRPGPPISCTINQTELFPNWSLSNVSSGATGSCTQDPVTGIVTLTFTAIVSNGICTCPVTVTYSG